MPRSSRTALSRAVQALLMPVLAFCMRRSMKLQEITELSKTTLVKLAQRELERRGEVVSNSKISLMTGVHRKDVAILLDSKILREKTSSDIVRKVIGQWKSDPRFTTAEGDPRPLKHIGSQSEFAELVRAVNLEMNTYSIFFELERVGAIAVKDDVVTLETQEYVPYGKLEEQFGLVSSDVNDLVRAAESNILKPEPVPHLHLATTYDNVAVESIPIIRKWFVREGAKLHERARRFLSKHDCDLNRNLTAQLGGGRVVVGTFSFTEQPGKVDGVADSASSEHGKKDV